MNLPLIGRKKEQQVLNEALQSDQAELVSLIGRRRVGKTFLVQSVYEERIAFEMTGIQHAPRQEQLQNFAIQLSKYTASPVPLSAPDNWLNAFFLLSEYLENRPSDQKPVVFLDELPWMATHRSGFLRGFGWFWNSWAVKKNIVVVICGSAASWMIQRVVRDKGGLHNRITRRINLEALNLAETEQFLKVKSPNIDRYQILQIYMAMGGIPHYLKEVRAGRSAVQNIDNICFSSSGLLHDEFSLLYPALFDNPEEHLKVVRTLAANRQGLTRKGIVQKTKLSNGGGTTRVLEELVHSGFVTPYYSFGKKKREMRYRLTDEYSLFYLKFIEKNRTEGEGTWKKLSQTQSWKSWSGYAFESIGLKHIRQLKRALEIGGVYSEASVLNHPGTDEFPGFQIDLLIDRNDHVINLFEMKFYNQNFILTKAYAEELRLKIAAFKAATKTRKQVFLNVLTTFPLVQNAHTTGLVDQAFTMDVLFE